jgi:hypothetical protein
MYQIAFRSTIVLLAGVGVIACNGPSDEPSDGPSGPTSGPAAQTYSSGAGCTAEASWITSPSLPAEVGGSQEICDFEKFAWQSLLYLVQPTPDERQILEFETWMPYYGIFVGADQQPTPYGQHPPDPCNPREAVAGRAIGAAPFIFSSITKQAGVEHALFDPAGKPAWYNLRVNESAYDMLTRCDLYRSHCAGQLIDGNVGIDVVAKYPDLSFPDGAVELKTGWKTLTAEEAASGLFYTVSGWVQPETTCEPVTLGLVGIHIVSKTQDFPAFLWATFEHRNNAPDCTDLDAPPPLGGSWSFFDPAACDNCTTNRYDPPNPTQVCRMHPQGDSTLGVFPNGQDCEVDPLQYACQEATRKMLAESTGAIREINASAQSLIASHGGEIDKVWANYELVGNVWTRDQVITPPQLQAQVGSLSAANTTMETYVQNGEAGVTATNSCFSCHDQSYKQGIWLPPAGLSHIFAEAVPDTGGCTGGSLPDSCSPYTGDDDATDAGGLDI